MRLTISIFTVSNHTIFLLNIIIAWIEDSAMIGACIHGRRQLQYEKSSFDEIPIYTYILIIVIINR